MQVGDIFSSLSMGVLSNLSIGGEGSGSIPLQHHRRIATMIEKSLIQIYGRFNLREREMILRVRGVQTEYPLLKKFAYMDPAIGQKFIEDTPENIYTEDLLKVLQIFNADGDEMKLNDPGDDTSLFTPENKLLLIPTPVNGDRYHLLYQSLHPKIITGSAVSLMAEILLPEFLVAALEHHVAYQVMSPMNGPEHSSKGGEHLSRYEMICLDAEMRDLTTTSLSQSHQKLNDRGFV